MDELFAFRYFESVIMVPKVRTDFNQYCHIDKDGRLSNMVVKCFLAEKIQVISTSGNCGNTKAVREVLARRGKILKKIIKLTRFGR